MTTNIEQQDLLYFRKKLQADPTNENLLHQLALLETAGIINRINIAKQSDLPNSKET